MFNDKKKILIVEDEETIRSMYETHLKNKGYEVLVADNGKQGLELAQNAKPDLILLDVILPQKDGFTVLGKIKADKDIKNIPVIMLTNLKQKEDGERGRKLGAIDYLVKADLTPAQIGEKIVKLLS